MAPSSVFVDPSGRRARWVARACWSLGGLLAVYVALVVLSLVAPPGVTRLGLGPLLPRPVAPPLTDASGAPRAPQQLLPSARPTPSPRPTRANGTTGGSTPSPGAAGATSSRRPTTAPSAGPTPTVTSRPSVRPTTHPTHPTPGHTPPPHR